MSSDIFAGISQAGTSYLQAKKQLDDEAYNKKIFEHDRQMQTLEKRGQAGEQMSQQLNRVFLTLDSDPEQYDRLAPYAQMLISNYESLYGPSEIKVPDKETFIARAKRSNPTETANYIQSAINMGKENPQLAASWIMRDPRTARAVLGEDYDKYINQQGKPGDSNAGSFMQIPQAQQGQAEQQNPALFDWQKGMAQQGGGMPQDVAGMINPQQPAQRPYGLGEGYTDAQGNAFKWQDKPTEATPSGVDILNQKALGMVTPQASVEDAMRQVRLFVGSPEDKALFAQHFPVLKGWADNPKYWDEERKRMNDARVDKYAFDIRREVEQLGGTPEQKAQALMSRFKAYDIDIKDEAEFLKYASKILPMTAMQSATVENNRNSLTEKAEYHKQLIANGVEANVIKRLNHATYEATRVDNTLKKKDPKTITPTQVIAATSAISKLQDSKLHLQGQLAKNEALKQYNTSGFFLNQTKTINPLYTATMAQIADIDKQIANLQQYTIGGMPIGASQSQGASPVAASDKMSIEIKAVVGKYPGWTDEQILRDLYKKHPGWDYDATLNALRKIRGK